MSLHVELVKKWEGLKLDAYQDVAGVWTIGYGSTGPHVKPGMRIGPKRAEELLEEDLSRFVKAVDEKVTVPIDGHQRAALISLAFNIGVGAFSKSTLLRKLNAGDYLGAANEFPKWRKAGGQVIRGLVRRREDERALFMTTMGTTKVDAPVDEPKVASGGVEGGEAKPMAKSKTQWLSLSGVFAALVAMYQDFNAAAPDVVEKVGPVLIIALIFGGIMLNRWLESRKGEH